MIKELVYLVMALVTYFGLACAVLMPVVGWPWYDCIYFATVTASTVGYGDISPGAHEECLPASNGSTDGALEVGGRENADGCGPQSDPSTLAALRLFTVLLIFFGILSVTARLGAVVRLVTIPFDAFCASSLEALFPERQLRNARGEVVLSSTYIFYFKYLLPSIFLNLVIQLISAAVYAAIEGERLDYGTAVYLCFVTATTVGYGDVLVETPAGNNQVPDPTLTLTQLKRACRPSTSHSPPHPHTYPISPQPSPSPQVRVGRPSTSFSLSRCWPTRSKSLTNCVSNGRGRASVSRRLISD